MLAVKTRPCEAFVCIQPACPKALMDMHLQLVICAKNKAAMTAARQNMLLLILQGFLQ